MKLKFIYPFAAVLAAGIFTSCDKNDEFDAPAKATESSFARLLITDKTSNTVTLLNPAKNEQSTFQSSFGGGTVYATPAGRWATVVSTANNTVEFFDTGIEQHDDHVHVKGTFAPGDTDVEVKFNTTVR